MSLLNTFFKLRSPLGIFVRYKQVPCKRPGGSDPRKKERKSAKKSDCIPNPALKKTKCDSKGKREASPCKSKPKVNPCQTKPKHSDICKPRKTIVQKAASSCKSKESTKVSKCKSSSVNKVLTINSMNPNVIKVQYAVRGPLVIRATALEEELMKGDKKPFSVIIKANIGDAQAMGQVPLTYFRQVMAGALDPALLKKNMFPEDVVKRVCEILDACGGRSVGSYTGSQGIDMIRKDVANYISTRDGYDCDYNNVFLCAGASAGIKNILKLLVNKIQGKDTGVMIPIPQYPLYSAALDEYGLGQCHYYLNEDSNWSLDVGELQRAYKEHSRKYAVRALVIINPGNPTGQLLPKENVADVLKFAAERNLFVLADEVYQHNIWSKGGKFHSFKKVLMENSDLAQKLELASFMSVSKGYFCECGLRGGWCELTNVDPDVRAELYKACSANLCPPSIGQIAVSCATRTPKQGDPSYELFAQERDITLKSLKDRAEIIVSTFNSMEGFKCNPVQGAMYAFPRINLPKKAIEAAKGAKQTPDTFYAFQLLEKTGVCVVPGSGFGQRPGTYHFRTTILPQMPLLKQMLTTFKQFHNEFTKKYS